MKTNTVLQLLRWTILVWRFDAMYKQTMSIAKGIGVGVLAGAAVATVAAKSMSGKHRKNNGMKKSAEKAIHTVGSLIGDVEKMLR